MEMETMSCCGGTPKAESKKILTLIVDDMADCPIVEKKQHYPIVSVLVDGMDCWDFPKIDPTPKVKLLNRKYCRLYPEEKKILKKLETKFDHCKTLYTKCDFKLETCAHAQILKIEDELRRHKDLQDSEINLQNELIDNLWVLSQRFLILTSSGVCVKPYPEIISKTAETDALCEFHKKLKALNISNCRLTASLGNIRNSIAELDRRCAQLDMSVDSIFIVGNHSNRPLGYVREIISDVFKFFYGFLCKLQSWAQLIDPGDSGAIEDYMALVKPSEDFQNWLMIGMEHCKCLRTQNPECITKFKNKCKQYD